MKTILLILCLSLLVSCGPSETITSNLRCLAKNYGIAKGIQKMLLKELTDSERKRRLSREENFWDTEEYRLKIITLIEKLDPRRSEPNCYYAPRMGHGPKLSREQLRNLVRRERRVHGNIY